MSRLLIREAVKEDARAFLKLWPVLDCETEFLLYEPDERKVTFDEQYARLHGAEGSEDIMILIAESIECSKLIGFAIGNRSANIRDKHTLNIALAIQQKYTGKGLGTEFLLKLEGWAKQQKIRRVELKVMTNNEFAIRLYNRMGYQIEGTLKMSVQLKSGFVDEYIMAKLI